MRRLHSLLTAILFAVVVLSAMTSLAANNNYQPSAATPEVRALWVDGFNPGIRTRQEAEQLVANAKQAGINTLFVQVRRRADALYSNSLEPAVEDFTIENGFDPLQNIIELAHREGIEVHAWMNAMTVWKNQALPTSANHILNLHGMSQSGRANWLTANPKGEYVFPVGYFLDPGHPDAMQHLVDVYTSVARNYAVDGIHFDYIRYPEVEGEKLPQGAPVGYNPISIERFCKATGRTGTPDPGDTQFIEWRRQQVTNLVRRVYLEVKAINPKIKISAATIAWGKPPVGNKDYPASAPMQLVFQDWGGWLKQGFLDMAVPMNYAREADPKSRGFFDGWIQWEKKNKSGRQLVVGVGSYLNSAEGTLAEISRVRKPEGRYAADGVSFFSYASLLRSANGSGKGTPLSCLYDGQAAPFVRPAPLPQLATPMYGWLAGTVRDASGTALDGAVVEVRRAGWNPFGRKQKLLTDGNGFFGTSGLKPGRYQATVIRAADKRITSQIDVAAGKVARVDISAGQ
ncbi:MAG TPA: family 10 glycosylhydrolase [Terriglobales bacterium]|nr:family 10 glycosylhydrolase [Terriglobales bacterium]